MYVPIHYHMEHMYDNRHEYQLVCLALSTYLNDPGIRQNKIKGNNNKYEKHINNIIVS